VTTTPLTLPLPASTVLNNSTIHHTNLYAYTQINYPHAVTWTIGGSADFLTGAIVERDQLNPKFGVTWNLFPATTLRAAAFRVLKRTLIADQTLEPTQVAGFNQFFDDGEGTDSWRYGVAIDQKFSVAVYGGMEFSRRELKVPFNFVPAPPAPPMVEVRHVDWKEDLARAYLYWTPHPWLATSVEYQYEQFDRDIAFVAGIEHLKTHRLPLGVNFYHPSGFIARLRATYVNQRDRFQPQLSAPGTTVPGQDQFWVVDTALSYRLPKRFGLITFAVRNLFDTTFKFQDTDPANPMLQPARSIFARFTLAF
jgi:outer membrane receptor protein involved in Fe transport